jgi:hypothetical protein
MNEQSIRMNDDGGEELLKKLRTAVSDTTDDDLTRMVESHRASINLAINTRGDPFSRNDVLVLSAESTGNDIRIACEDLPVSVGREGRGAADVEIAGEGISGCHFLLERDGPLLMLRDASSKNGTYLNDLQIEAEHLCEGDRITVGFLELVVKRA